jgi:LysM repeat protein
LHFKDEERRRSGLSGRTIVNTLKSAAVILVLAGVLYSVYTALNKPQTQPPTGMSSRDIDDMAPPEIDFAAGGATELPAPPGALTLRSESESPADLEGSSPPDTSPPGFGSSNSDKPSTSVPSIYGQGVGNDADAASPAGSTAAGSYNRRSNFEAPAPTDNPATAESPAATSPAIASATFRRDAQLAEQHVNDGKFRTALATLSAHYHVAELSAEERAQLLAWLDALAAKVIYSREHLLESPYVVRGQETLFNVAERLHVTAELLANINGVTDPRILLPGTELKVVPGPMRADVALDRGELTLFVGDLYAGRFPISLGSEPPSPGEFAVQSKSIDRTYIGPDGRTIPANDPSNPYGQCWIDLGTSACIHGSPLSAAPGTQTLGCISLSPQDARDVYAMLVTGSKVTIRR